jgi:ATP-dependent DNA ligase
LSESPSEVHLGSGNAAPDLSPKGFQAEGQPAVEGGTQQKIRRPMCPFVNLPEKTRGRWGLGITPAVMRTCTWVEPVLVAQIKFTERTSDNQLRQPVFLGLRTDKAAKEVVRE